MPNQKTVIKHLSKLEMIQPRLFDMQKNNKKSNWHKRSLKTNKKAIWKYINSRSRSSKPIGHLRNKDGTLTETYTLANQYLSVFTEENLSNMPGIEVKDVTTRMPPLIITRNYVNDQLNILRINKSPGPDNIHPRVLHESAHVIDVAFAILFNKLENCKYLNKKYLSKNIKSVQRRTSKLSIAMMSLSYEERLHSSKTMNNLDAVDEAIDCSKCGSVNMFEMYSNSRTRGHQFKIKNQQTYLKRHYFFCTRVAPI